MIRFLPLLLGIMLFTPKELRAQTAIKGVVQDQTTGEVLVGVNVSLDNYRKGTFTDESGAFQLDATETGNLKLVFSYIGYTTLEVEVQLAPESTILDLGQVELEAEAFSLGTVTVTPGSFNLMGNPQLSRQTLSEKDIKNMSWAEDITRVVARLPGISSNDFSSKFSIRGGEDDEVLISLDGMELYEPFHQRDYSGGLFSIVDIETIQGIELMTGGFSAAYGNRLSGVFNMRTKHIADDQRHASVGLSVMNGRFYTDGKFAKNKGSYLFSARRSMLDLLFRLGGFTESLPSFYDGMFKVEYALNAKHSLSLHLLQAGDKLAIRDSDELGNFDRNDTQYGNSYGWLTLKSYLSPKLSARSLLYAGRVSHDRNGAFHKYEPSDKGDFALADKRLYNFYGLKQDWSWQASNHYFLNAGF
ncbi:MAG: carboxypeptidase-like regulatory domain-containing protein, partial [Phaeodactylibacter sp.]|nr:carboxypeptidase-like regulatory domain-containing protein [Phaeodactylibacter sp.]